MNSETPTYVRILLYLATQIPLFLILGIGAVIALCLVKRHLGVSLLTIAGFGIIGLTYIGASTVHNYGAEAIIKAANENPEFVRSSLGDQLRIFHNVVNTLVSMCLAGGYFLLLCAIFCWRRSQGAAAKAPIAQVGESPFR